jgi:hypothetical protein
MGSNPSAEPQKTQMDCNEEAMIVLPGSERMVDYGNQYAKILV